MENGGEKNFWKIPSFLTTFLLPHSPNDCLILIWILRTLYAFLHFIFYLTKTLIISSLFFFFYYFENWFVIFLMLQGFNPQERWKFLMSQTPLAFANYHNNHNDIYFLCLHVLYHIWYNIQVKHGPHNQGYHESILYNTFDM